MLLLHDLNLNLICQMIVRLYGRQVLNFTLCEAFILVLILTHRFQVGFGWKQLDDRLWDLKKCQRSVALEISDSA